MSPDDRAIALGCGPSLVLLDPMSEVTSVATAKDSFDIRDVTFSPDSRTLAVHVHDAVIVYGLERGGTPNVAPDPRDGSGSSHAISPR